MGAVEKDGEVVFLHKMMEGPADKSYGIHVAKIAGLPSPLLERAATILSALEAEETTIQFQFIMKKFQKYMKKPSNFHYLKKFQQKN